MKIALLCGGPSPERGISLNSARTVLSHLEEKNIEILPIYFDFQKRAFHISTAQLYSNNPSDFDFKLRETASELSTTQLIQFLKKVDLVFPVMHGEYGEDGGIQKLLEKGGLPFVGSDSQACEKAFDKFRANSIIREYGFFALPSLVITDKNEKNRSEIRAFFAENALQRAIVKPATGGSSIGVCSVSSPQEAYEKACVLLSSKFGKRVVIEPFAEGTEFTTIILQNRFGMPVAILPTEIETDYSQHQIFDYRKKYLPTRQVTYHCPPRFSNEIIEKIQVQAEQLFTVLGMRDFARFDGWILKDGNIWFSDFNPVSGMEQNSFLFQQTSRIGFSHRDTLRFITKHACDRLGIHFPEKLQQKDVKRKQVNILFGGKTSERQVSIMSGTNVWLKLRQSEKYFPQPYILDKNNNVWKLPYTYTLNHTVEEIIESCKKAKEGQKRLTYLEQKVRQKLSLRKGDDSEILALPEKKSLHEFIQDSPFVFLALHGGEGENGILQAKLERAGKKFNASPAKVSRLCMDKWQTNRFIDALHIPSVSTTQGVVIDQKELKTSTASRIWAYLLKKLQTKTLIAKPRADGCSSGVVHLQSEEDLQKYVSYALNKRGPIPKGTFSGQKDIIEMPLEPLKEILFEKYIVTDEIRVTGNRLILLQKSGWIEITTGVLEKNSELHALNPSLTIAEGEVLSVEEKFQGGTGVNITPPPKSIVSNKILQRTKKSIALVAKKVGIRGYARIDAFLNTVTGELCIIEINTLPGLTPSTVLYHQGLTEKPPLFPKELLERIIESTSY